MADIRDERGNPIYLTDEQGKPAQLVDEFGNAMHLTGVATTVPHLKESSYTGPHPITAPITTTDTPHHAQPISVSHNPLENMGISSSNSMDEYGQGSRQGANVTDETKSKVEGHDPSTATVSGSGSEETHEKKGFLKKIKEKISGNHNDPYTTSPHLFSEEAEKAFARVRDKVKMPLYGCDCYAYALLASGLVDLVIESGLTPYDFLALVPVIQGAGGTITDWNGNSLLWEASSSAFATIAAGDSDIHQQALESLEWQ